jgi:cytochrome c-type biogenesis protein CcmH
MSELRHNLKVIASSSKYCLIALLLVCASSNAQTVGSDELGSETLNTSTFNDETLDTAGSATAELSDPIVTAENYAFDDAAQRRVFLDLTAVLRCPMCQNQNIADSDAMIAHDMRRKVYQLLKQGNSREEVIGFMKERYGDFVYYQPPVTPVTIWLWALPVIFAVVMMLVFVFKRKTKPEDDIQAKLAAANKLLKDE